MNERSHSPLSAGAVLLLALLALAAVARGVLYDTLDPDCFWHLRVAEQLEAQGIGPLVDDISFSSSREPWTPYSWLAELGMKQVWDRFGFAGAVATQAILGGLIVTFMALACLEAADLAAKRENRPIHAFRAEEEVPIVLGTAFGTLFMLPYLSFRPVTLAIFLLAVVVWLLLRDRRLDEQSRAVWWIVPITALLTNIHLYALLVPVWVAALAAGAAWERSGRSLRRYLALSAAAAAACLMTPMLPGMLRTAIFYRLSDEMVAGNLITEMQPFYVGIYGAWMLAAAIVFGIVALIGAKRLTTGEWAWVILGTVLLCQLGRLALLFALTASPALAATMPRVFSGTVLRRRAVTAGIGLVLIAGVWKIAIGFPSAEQTLEQWANRHGPDAPGYPCEAASYVERAVRPASGRILNEFTWGGYLAWRLGDRYQVFMDGRTQVYPREFWRATYLEADVSPNLLSDSRADAAIVPAAQSRLHSQLVQLGWSAVYRDERSIVLVPE